MPSSRCPLPRFARLVTLLAVGCARDVVLDADSVCGDFVLEGSEECDVASAGCVECRVAPGWTCGDTDCASTCGDGVVVGDEECEPPDGVSCDTSCRAGEKDQACDASGWWIARETSYSIDDVLNQTQVSANWYVFSLEQTGEIYRVLDSLFCGIQVLGTATAELSEASTRALMRENPMGLGASRGPRTGTFAPGGDGCTFSMGRHYTVRGVEERFLPPDFSTHPELSSLEPLPTESNPEEPTGEDLDGAIDQDGDGKPGVAFVLSGNANGVRNVAMRDWAEYVPSPDYPIPAFAIEFSTASRFDNQESILAVSECPLLGCGLLLAGSAPAVNGDHHVTFRYLGADLSERRVTEIVTAELGLSEDSDATTCENTRAALPHEGTNE